MSKQYNVENDKPDRFFTKTNVLVLISCVALGGFYNYNCPDDGEAKIIMEKSKDLEKKAGFLKDGDEFIPFYCFNPPIFKKDLFFNLNTAERIGYSKQVDFGDNCFSGISEMEYGDTTWAEPQIIYFDDCYPNIYLDYETVLQFDDEVYENLEKEYLKNKTFDSNLINVYKLKNISTDEEKIIVGYQLSDTQFFNFETYQVEEYKGYGIDCILKGSDLKKEEGYSYTEILDIISETKEKQLQYKG